jgi:hypothetical protein
LEVTVKLVRFASTLVLTLAATACSEDDSPSSTPESQANANQPSANAGAAGAAGAGSAGAAGAAGSNGATPPANGAAGEGPAGNIGLDPDDDDGNAGNGASDADASAPTPPPAADASVPTPPPAADAGPLDDTTMSFFVTSRGGPDGANLGGLAGADALCVTLASAVSPALGAKDWKAYLSTTTVNARDRIGSGPWFNAAGVLVANTVAQLTDQAAGGTLDQTWAPGDASIALDELGAPVPTGGAGGVQHDILTGTQLDGTVAAGLTCGDWTAVTGNVQVGHSNRGGFGDVPTSWSSAHTSGCAPLTAAPAPNVGSGGGRGSIYCFAAD